MATGKKFYWIKLKKDFMTGDVVDFLMSQRNGAQYVVLYQMLCMMCINTRGTLSQQIGELIIPFDADKIQRDCKYFSRDTIAIALGLFKKVGLIYEQDAGVLAISGFENLVGYETDYAIQKRNQRQLTDSMADSNKDCYIDRHVDTVHTGVPDIAVPQAGDSTMDKSVDNVHTDIRDKSLDTEKDSVTVSDETVCPTNVQRIARAWNELQSYGIKPVSKISSISKRYESLAARIKQYSVSDILAAIEKIKSSDFLQGKNSNGWTITFDWFVRPNNFPKVLEGNYDNKVIDGNMNTGNLYDGKIANRNNGAVKKNEFNNFHQRNYDYEKLEKMLLNPPVQNKEGQ